MQIWAESGKSALPICNYSQILYQFLAFTQNLKQSLMDSMLRHFHLMLQLYRIINHLRYHQLICLRRIV